MNEDKAEDIRRDSIIERDIELGKACRDCGTPMERNYDYDGPQTCEDCYDPTPSCHTCERSVCDCGPIADNN